MKVAECASIGISSGELTLPGFRGPPACPGSSFHDIRPRTHLNGAISQAGVSCQVGPSRRSTRWSRAVNGKKTFLAALAESAERCGDESSPAPPPPAALTASSEISAQVLSMRVALQTPLASATTVFDSLAIKKRDRSYNATRPASRAAKARSGTGGVGAARAGAAEEEGACELLLK